MPERVGWIGLGQIGLPMMRRLFDAGHIVTAYDKDIARMALGHVPNGPRAPADVAKASDVVFLNLPDGDAVADVVFGANGCASAGMTGKLIVDTSSIDPTQTKEFAQRLAGMGGRWVDAPVSGGAQAAEQGVLVALLGGADADVAKAEALVGAFASKQAHLGPCGSGQWGKLVNQAIVCGTIALWSESLTLARAGGIDARTLVDALAGAGADSRVRAAFAPQIAAGTFVPSANLTKDIAAVLAHVGGDKKPALLEETARVINALRLPPP